MVSSPPLVKPWKTKAVERYIMLTGASERSEGLLPTRMARTQAGPSLSAKARMHQVSKSAERNLPHKVDLTRRAHSAGNLRRQKGHLCVGSEASTVEWECRRERYGSKTLTRSQRHVGEIAAGSLGYIACGPLRYRQLCWV
ncbi:unnamed protein product [Caenorhabditis auriculariae]|uniref:Uncharacterized protein n=1 Tax=Caenorhabditis auriculariae TaxID=2777116 RepID=A0A8S1HEP3_9PELO|nr:unnamed protein product [Caenorhabditis auriculariae]